jgi:hypothetical protein
MSVKGALFLGGFGLYLWLIGLLLVTNGVQTYTWIDGYVISGIGWMGIALMILGAMILSNGLAWLIEARYAGMKKPWRFGIFSVILVVALIFTSMIILQKPSPTPSEKAILKASDMHDSNWIDDGPYVYELYRIQGEADFCYEYLRIPTENNTNHVQAVIFLDHFNNTDDALSNYQYRSDLNQNSSWEITHPSFQMVEVGNKGFLEKTSDYSDQIGRGVKYDENRSQELMFFKGHYVAMILIMWESSYNWSSINTIQMGQFQADKIP